MLVIAQFKFVATYLVPAVWPSVLYGAAILASLVMPPPGSEWPFAANVLMWCGILTMLASLALLLKKLFGRAPSLTEVLSGLVTTKALVDYKEDQRLRSVGLEKQISSIRHDLDKSLTESLQREETRAKAIQEMRDSVSRLQERTETHIRTLDRYDQRFEALLQRISDAASLATKAVQAAQDALDRSNRKS